MKRKERLVLEEKLYDIISEKYSGCVVVNNEAIDPIKANCDFAYDKRIVELLKTDIIEKNKGEIHKQFEKWLNNNYDKYRYRKIVRNLENKALWWYIWSVLGWIAALWVSTYHLGGQ